VRILLDTAVAAPIARPAIEDLDIRILPFTAKHALHLFEPIHHGDPWDRQIIAPSLGRENSGCHSR
jgi:PIN domain nuclease of toxin-antitoxin system